MNTLLIVHSIMRWLVVIFILVAIFDAFRGYRQKRSFSNTSNFLRHWTATFAHIQLVLGILLATKSPYFSYFRKNMDDAMENTDALFFGLIHPLLMLIAIIVLTIGSAKAKRKEKDADKYKTMLIWFSIVVILIFVAIPWPFSPITSRPYITFY